jgi:hypothetical protein
MHKPENSLHLLGNFIDEQWKLILTDELRNVIIAVEASAGLQYAASNGLGYRKRGIRRLSAVALNNHWRGRRSRFVQFF